METNPHAGEQGEQDAPLREEDVTVSDRLDDRVQEGEGLANDEQEEGR